MDLVLDYADNFVLTPYVYPASLPESNPYRQLVSLFVITTAGGYFLYLATAWLGYAILFDKRLLRHPLILDNQIRREIAYASKSIPIMGVLTTGVFFFEVRGHAKLYDSYSETRLGYLTLPITVACFILFTDCLIYWIHRFLHHKLVYKYIHKGHHLWKVPTPFASHAFHPIDGFLQSLPYHAFPFLFPLHKLTYLGLFVFVNVWTVSIHDGYYSVPVVLRPFVNGSAHHTDHHLYYNYNYGQFFTLWDRLGDSFRQPSALCGQGPLQTVLDADAKANGARDNGKSE